MNLVPEPVEPGIVISICVQYEYRNARLDFVCGFLNQPILAKRQQVVHELMHLHVAPLANFARDKINLLVPIYEADKFNKSLMADLTSIHEACTQDLADVIMRLDN